jgi:hypothetical protein
LFNRQRRKLVMSYYYTNDINDKDRPLRPGNYVKITDDSWGFVIRADGTTSDTCVDGADYTGQNAVLIALDCVFPVRVKDQKWWMETLADDATQPTASFSRSGFGPDCVCRHESGDVLFLRSAFLERLL